MIQNMHMSVLRYLSCVYYSLVPRLSHTLVLLRGCLVRNKSPKAWDSRTSVCAMADYRIHHARVIADDLWAGHVHAGDKIIMLACMHNSHKGVVYVSSVYCKDLWYACNILFQSVSLVDTPATSRKVTRVGKKPQPLALNFDFWFV